MKRHTFLKAQEWLQPLDDSPTDPSQVEAGSSAVTTFVGAASLHVSPCEQYSKAGNYAGKHV
jgi:hypothetical protein